MDTVADNVVKNINNGYFDFFNCLNSKQEKIKFIQSIWSKCDIKGCKVEFSYVYDIKNDLFKITKSILASKILYPEDLQMIDELIYIFVQMLALSQSKKGYLEFRKALIELLKDYYHIDSIKEVIDHL